MALGGLADSEVEDVASTRREKVPGEGSNLLGVTRNEGGEQLIRDGAGRSVEVWPRGGCVCGTDAQQPQGILAPEKTAAVYPRATVLVGVVPSLHPASEGGPVCPLHEDFDALLDHLCRYSRVHRAADCKVGFAGP